MAITLEKATSKDADVLHALQVKSFLPTLKKYNDKQTNPACEPLEKTLGRIDGELKEFYKILKDNVLVGGIAIKHTSSDTLFLGPLFINPDYQNQKIAQEALRLIESIYLDVIVFELATISNEKGNIHLYEKMGYMATGEAKQIGNSLDVIFFRKKPNTQLRQTITSLNFRKASFDDLEKIIWLLADDQLGQEREQSVSNMNPAYKKVFNQIIADPNQSLMVVEKEGSVVGTCHLTFIPSLTFQGGLRMNIEAVRVDSFLRGQGIGEWMLNKALELAKAKGCRIVQLTTNKKRTDALRFYEKLGFKATHEGMKLYLCG